MNIVTHSAVQNAINTSISLSNQSDPNKHFVGLTYSENISFILITIIVLQQMPVFICLFSDSFYNKKEFFKEFCLNLIPFYPLYRKIRNL